MSRRDYSEDTLQNTTASFLEKELGWQNTYAFEKEDFGADSLLGRLSKREAVLTREVMAALRRLNPGLPAEVYQEALDQVQAHDSAKGLIQRNEEKHGLLKDGVLVTWKDKNGRKVERRLKLIDFDKKENNRFHAVREFTIQGNVYERRADIIGFVNGLPLIFIEMKRQDIPVENAYQHNYRDYLDTVPHLFDWNALVIITNGHDARYGSVSSGLEHFYRWKRLDEDDPEPDKHSPLLPILLKGMLHPLHLLDIVENFILFDTTGGSTQKVIARNHQYLGVNRVIARLTSQDPVIQKEVADGKLGVFWHTQGSGKSYSMVFLTEKIHRKLSASWSFIIVTDRNELDNQIAGTYTNCDRANTKTDQAHNGTALRRMLGEQNQRYIFTLVQKFRENIRKPYSLRDNILVISDEAHRTQYGRLATNMRRGLPNAKFLGLTGTPLIDSAERQQTREVFGDYVSIYDFQRAVADGATLPLYYENAGEKLKLIDETINQRIVDYIKDAKEKAAAANDLWTDEKEDKIYRHLKKEYAVLSTPTRLDRIAEHFVQHFSKRWLSGDNGQSKAMLVCLDKITCVKMYDLITEKWQALAQQLDDKVTKEEQLFKAQGKAIPAMLEERRRHITWMQETECCVVVSSEQGEVEQFQTWKNHHNEPLDIVPHRKKMKTRDLEKEFKTPEHPFRIAIVCAMWLTGFDVKPLTTLYLDKPMQGHTLMQAIARANRVWGQKKNGYIVDYNGMVRSLRRALATFAQGDRSASDTGTQQPELAVREPSLKDEQEALAEYRQSLQEGIDLLEREGFDINELIEASKTPEGGFMKVQKILEAVDLLSSSAQLRQTFRTIACDIEARRRGLFPMKGLFEYDDLQSALEAIDRKLQDTQQSPDISQLLPDLHDVVATALEVQPLRVQERPVFQDLSRLDLNRIRDEFARTSYKNIVMTNLQEKIAARLDEMVTVNPSRLDLYERYSQIVERYNASKDRATTQQVFDELTTLVDSLNNEDKRCMREGLTNQTHLAVFDLLQKPSLTRTERDRIKQVAGALLKILSEDKFRMDRLRSMAVMQAQMKSTLLEHLYTYLPTSYTSDEIEQRSQRIFEYAFSHDVAAAMHREYRAH